MCRGTEPHVVLGPDVFARSFFDETCFRVLALWRDGRVRLAVSRELLRHYLRVLRALGVPESQQRQWGQWFTAQEKALYMPAATLAGQGIGALLEDAARRMEAAWVVTVLPRPESEPGRCGTWASPEEFLSAMDG